MSFGAVDFGDLALLKFAVADALKQEGIAAPGQVQKITDDYSALVLSSGNLPYAHDVMAAERVARIRTDPNFKAALSRSVLPAGAPGGYSSGLSMNPFMGAGGSINWVNVALVGAAVFLIYTLVKRRR